MHFPMELPQKVFMEITEGCNKQDIEKSLYGLKEVSRLWNLEFNKFIVKHNFKVSTCDESLYYLKRLSSTEMFLLLYVDNILISLMFQM